MDLAGKLMVAMPAMGDERFAKSVILICAHSDEGAMGLIINKPVPDFSFADLLTQLKIARRSTGRDICVHFGGPWNADAALCCIRPITIRAMPPHGSRAALA